MQDVHGWWAAVQGSKLGVGGRQGGVGGRQGGVGWDGVGESVHTYHGPPTWC